MRYFDYKPYAQHQARRFIRYRRSGMLDENDLVSSAMIRLWERESQSGELEEKTARREVRLAMLDVLRNSSLIRTPRGTPMNQAIQAYRDISTIGQHEEPRFDQVNDWVESEPVRDVWIMVEGFSEEDKLLLSLIWEEGCSYQEAAEVLGLSKSQIGHRYQELIKKLKAKILVQKRQKIR